MILLPPLSGKTGVAALTYHQLTQEERYFISTRLRTGASIRSIAKEMGRSCSTVSRERARNRTNHDGIYRAAKAQQYAQARRRRCRRRSIFGPDTWLLVHAQIRRKWSPEQIVGAAKLCGYRMASWRTIYRHIHTDRRRGGTLWRFTRIISKNGRKRYRSIDNRGMLPGKRHITERPPCVESRQEFGHWEGDTVMGSDMRHCVLTLVERSTGHAHIRKLKNRTMAEATSALLQIISGRPSDFKTITFDNGTEFHDYKAIERHFATKCYFATPYHSWERGTNESFNGLLRQYIPKGMCMSTLTQAECNTYSSELNRRPRKRLGFRTPEWMYHQVR